MKKIRYPMSGRKARKELRRCSRCVYFNHSKDCTLRHNNKNIYMLHPLGLCSRFVERENIFRVSIVDEMYEIEV